MPKRDLAPTAEELEIQSKLKDKGLGGLETSDGSNDNEILEEESDEEIVVEEEEGEFAEVDEDDSSQMSESEIQARESGWKPQDECDGNPDEWVSYREFNHRGELLKKIHNQNRQLKYLDDVVVNLAKQQKKIFDAGYDKAKRELKTALREANKEGDDATADALEERLEQLEEQRQADLKVIPVQESQAVVEQQPAPEFISWVKRNDWFIKNSALRSYAENIGLSHAQLNPQKTNVEIYQYVTDEVKKRFPEEFGTVMKIPLKKKPGSPVVGSSDLTSGKGRGPSGGTVRVSLSAEEKTVGRMLVDKGEYKNLNEYAADLKKFGVKV